MTEQQITEFDRWFDQLLDPELNLTPGDKELCRHAWQAALSHAEGEAQPVASFERMMEDCGARYLGDGCWEWDCETVEFIRRVQQYSHPAPQVLFSDTQEEIQARLIDQLENSCPYCLGSGHKDDVAAPQVADINAIAKTLQQAWAEAEAEHGVTKNPASYAATFVDMARAVAGMVPAAPQVAVPENAGNTIRDLATVLQSLVSSGRIDGQDRACLEDRDIQVSEVLGRADAMLAATPTAPAGEPECCCGETEQAWRLCPEHGPGTKHDRQRLAAKQPVSDPDGVPDITSTVINDACWTFIEAMPHQLPAPIFNDLKPALYEALKHYHRAALPAPDEREIAATSITALQSAFYEGFEAGATEDDGDDAWERSSARLRAGKEGKGHA